MNRDNINWQVYANFLNAANNSNIVFTANDGSGVMTLLDGAVRIPYGISDERPVSSAGGMIRYNTTDNLVEYFNGNVSTWLPISLPPPVLNSVTPNFISENATNTYTLLGTNFSTFGVSVVFTGNNGAGTVFTPDFETVVSDSTVNVQFDASNAFVDASNQLPMSATLTNDNSGFSSTLLNAVTAFNLGPVFVSPPDPAPSVINTFPVQDPSSSFTLQGVDLSTPLHYPLTFSISSGNPGGMTDISSIGDLSAVFKVPVGNRTDPTAGTYNFFSQITDSSGAINDPVQFRVVLADPTATSIDPSYITDASVSNINVTGNYFVIDSDISFTDTGSSEQLSKTGVTYNSLTSLTVTDVSAGSAGSYELSVRNGSVVVSVPSVFLNVVKPVEYSVTGFTTITKYYDQTGVEVGGPVLFGETLIYFITTATGSITFSNLGASIQSKALIVGGGGAGGFGHGAGGGGGAVLYRTDQSISNGTYPITVGAGGAATTSDSQNNQGGSSSAFSVTATGGGSGANEDGNDTSGRGGAGGNGANGGGGSYNARSGGTGTAPTATGWTVYAGYSGGTGNPGTAENYGCGGGGGAGGAGQTAVNPAGGSGANGIQIDIDGNNYYWAAGGGGVTYSASSGTGLSGSGGLGGGGGACSVNGTPGTGGGSALNSGGNGSNGAETAGGAGGANTGSGGGGGANENGTGGAGGSGIVILRFPSYAL
jgi:hypothetical protein